MLPTITLSRNLRPTVDTICWIVSLATGETGLAGTRVTINYRRSTNTLLRFTLNFRDRSISNNTNCSGAEESLERTTSLKIKTE